MRQQADLHLIYNPKLFLSYGFLNFNGNVRGLIIFHSSSPLNAQSYQAEDLQAEAEEELKVFKDLADQHDKSITEAIHAISATYSESKISQDERLFYKYKRGDVLNNLLFALRNAL